MEMQESETGTSDGDQHSATDAYQLQQTEPEQEWIPVVQVPRFTWLTIVVMTIGLFIATIVTFVSRSSFPSGTILLATAWIIALTRQPKLFGTRLKEYFLTCLEDKAVVPLEIIGFGLVYATLLFQSLWGLLSVIVWFALAEWTAQRLLKHGWWKVTLSWRLLVASNWLWLGSFWYLIMLLLPVSFVQFITVTGVLSVGLVIFRIPNQSRWYWSFLERLFMTGLLIDATAFFCTRLVHVDTMRLWEVLLGILLTSITIIVPPLKVSKTK